MTTNGTTNSKTNPARPKKLVLLPGIIIVILQLLLRFLLPALAPKTAAAGFIGGVVLGLALAVWWVFYSRAARIERWGALIVVILSMIAASFLLDESISTSNMGLMFILYSIPGISLAFIIWAAATRNLPTNVRRITMVLTIVLASGVWILIRTGGMTGDGGHNLAWRWSKTPEELMLSEGVSELSAGNDTIIIPDSVAQWPGFRGPTRDGIVQGIEINTDWKTSPPVELWRRPVGPGCSSFAVSGDLLFTQEQLGINETVSCFSLHTGKPIWRFGYEARFEEFHAGPGPRSTPTLSGKLVFALGATGILNVLDAGTGTLIWTRNAAADAGISIPGWGFSSSPLVVGKLVITALAGKLAAYDIATGSPAWFGPDGGSGYSSPHLVTLNGKIQVLFMSKSGAISVDPETGIILWDYKWEIMDRILQPSVIDGSNLLFSGENKSIRRIEVKYETTRVTVKDLWESTDFKVNFNDFIIHRGYAYGFDGPALTCIDLSDGRRMWRGARYRGFQILLAEQDLLLILTEKGEVAMVPALPDKFTELAKIQALKSKTWSHPVVAGDILVVRNHEEMVAYRLSPGEKAE